MSRPAAVDGITVRSYEDRDESAVLELLGASLGGGPAGVRPAEFFRWKHLENPFGRSFMIVATEADRIVGLRAFMRWRFACGERTVRAVRAVDTATHPEYQGRGIFTRLTRAAIDELRDEVDVIFNTPNEKSLPGYLKMGWDVLGVVPVRIAVRRPIRFARGIRSIGVDADNVSRVPVDAPSASEALESESEVAALLRARGGSWGRLATPRDLEFLRWRYGAAPLLDYRAVTLRRAGRVRGLAFFRSRMRGELREASVADVLVSSGDVGAAAWLLRRVGRTGRFDHVTCSFAPGTDGARGASRARCLPARRGASVVVNALRPGASEPDPRRLASWAFTLGDLEVF